MKSLSFYSMIVFALLMSSCDKESVKPEVVAPIVLTPKQQAVVNASNYFGFNMLREANQAAVNENYLISPLSISAALGMTWNGANGTTEQQMQDVLGFGSLSSQEINESYKELLNYLLSSDPKIAMEIANSIWYRDDFWVDPAFIATNQDYFSADVIAANFGDPATVGHINDWVSNNTHGKITSIVDNIPALTVMYLINATYFKGDWTYRFKETDTHTADFFPASGGSVPVDMMKQKSDLEIISNQQVQGVRLPYGDGRYYMFALMPTSGNTLDGIIAQLDTPMWDQWMNEFNKINAYELYFPKFKFEYEKSLNELLMNLGMDLPFQAGQADFSGINPNVPLYIDEVKHKSFIDVNEKGTEAAAITSVSINVTSVGSSLNFNQPFLFFIVEKHTGFVIFSGKVAEPEYN